MLHLANMSKAANNTSSNLSEDDIEISEPHAAPLPLKRRRAAVIDLTGLDDDIL
jgi:hypothetical protein